MFGKLATTGRYVDAAADLLETLSVDAYTDYLKGFYAAGRERFGGNWIYADIVTVLMALGDLLKPRRYLEIGVRRGRSACALASRAPKSDLFLFDKWAENYGGMENPGPDFVEGELAKVGHEGAVTFVTGDSHSTLSEFFRTRPDITFDVVTVDGDHTVRGAARDLCDALPRLTIGGAVVFDDICHPKHPGLRDVWRKLVTNDPRFSVWSYEDLGFGVGVGFRKW